MIIKEIPPKQIEFYHNLKKSLELPGCFVIGSKNRSIDFVVFNIKQDIQLYKIVPPWSKKSSEIWLSSLKKWYSLAWYKATYTMVFVNEDFQEIKRRTFDLN